MRISSNQGFTLIELVVVITVLGLLAAVALPRFAALQTEARIAKMQAAMGSVKSAAALAHALQLTQQKGSNESVLMEGLSISMTNAYPTAFAIVFAAGLVDENGVSTEGYAIVDAANGLRKIAVDGSRGNCAIFYTEAQGDFGPTYQATSLIKKNCS